MPLWNNTDNAAGAPKFLTAKEKEKVIFVSIEESKVDTNRAKGLVSPGWWLLDEYVTDTGKTRYRADHLVALSVATIKSGDVGVKVENGRLVDNESGIPGVPGNDNDKVAEVVNVITISDQPSNTAFNTDGDATFTINASVTNSGTVTYQWQRLRAGKYENIENATNNTLAFTGLTGVAKTAATGKYRVIVSSDNGAIPVTSNAVTLSV